MTLKALLPADKHAGDFVVEKFCDARYQQLDKLRSKLTEKTTSIRHTPQSAFNITLIIIRILVDTKTTKFIASIASDHWQMAAIR